MSTGKRLILALSIYAVASALIYLLLWYFDPSLNEYLRAAIISSPILVSVVLTRLLVGRRRN
ncbi:hypothetical protein H1D32_07795 [Anaerobacillus sp. CMMVII]|uniref:hypothetical protein n=1 Tax=Anaerobacillus sp. CMMVII TaxID=2755588 RepID=UPI0021B746A0|nr:hypothetical protein [Anaerobacillus sp. CMMVII]MCT8137665.1 hypothetical protein [Anaerobacillus sp. CMMVII]